LFRVLAIEATSLLRAIKGRLGQSHLVRPRRAGGLGQGLGGVAGLQPPRFGEVASGVGEGDLDPSVGGGIGLVLPRGGPLWMPTEQQECDLAIGLWAAEVRRSLAGGAFDAVEPRVK
jgi:hypothetical protein